MRSCRLSPDKPRLALPKAWRVILKVSHNNHASHAANAHRSSARRPQPPRGDARSGRDPPADWDSTPPALHWVTEKAEIRVTRSLPAGNPATVTPDGCPPGCGRFRDALPVLGVDGTLAEAVPATSPARGQVQAKTGTYVVGDPLNSRLLLRAKGLGG
jgi:hypothetical protein